jgi:transketolase
MKKLRQEFADTMVEVGSQDPRLVVMVGDISHGILQDFAKSCPGRYYNVGICEPTIVTMAAGIYRSGLIPVVHTIAPFIIERAYEQIKLDFGYQKNSVNLISVGGAFDYAQLGCSHHCYTDISLMSHFKKANIFCPASPVEFNQLFKMSYNNNEINYFRLTEYPHGVEFSPKQIQPGKAICVQEGKDVTVVALGSQLKTALQAAKELKVQKIELEILYYPTVKPFDYERLLKSVGKTKKVLVIEEASSFGSLFSYVLAAARDLLGVKYAQTAIEDFIHGYGTYEELLEKIGFTSKEMIAKVRRLMN